MHIYDSPKLIEKLQAEALAAGVTVAEYASDMLHLQYNLIRPERQFAIVHESYRDLAVLVASRGEYYLAVCPVHSSLTGKSKYVAEAVANCKARIDSLLSLRRLTSTESDSAAELLLADLALLDSAPKLQAKTLESLCLLVHSFGLTRQASDSLYLLCCYCAKQKLESGQAHTWATNMLLKRSDLNWWSELGKLA